MAKTKPRNTEPDPNPDAYEVTRVVDPARQRSALARKARRLPLGELKDRALELGFDLKGASTHDEVVEAVRAQARQVT